MKRCPACGRTFTNNTLVNCLNDGTTLVEDVSTPPPYLGATAAEASRFTETPPSFDETQSFAETPPPAIPPSEPDATVTYTNTPLSAIPELQSPEMQAALKEALDKAGMSGLLDAGSLNSTVSVTTSVTSQSGTPSDTGTPPYQAGPAAPRRKPRPWFGLFLILLLLFLVINGLRVLWHQVNLGVPADTTAAEKKR